jgi:hypothetical protein
VICEYSNELRRSRGESIYWYPGIVTRVIYQLHSLFLTFIHHYQILKNPSISPNHYSPFFTLHSLFSFSLYASTVLLIPSATLTCGRYPNRFLALVISNVLFIVKYLIICLYSPDSLEWIVDEKREYRMVYLICCTSAISYNPAICFVALDIRSAAVCLGSLNLFTAYAPIHCTNIHLIILRSITSVGLGLSNRLSSGC